MNTINKISRYLSGHRIQLAVVLCLFGLCVAQSRKVAKGRHRPKTDEEAQRLGVEWAVAQCRELYAHGVNNIHFYTVSAVNSVAEVARQLL